MKNLIVISICCLSIFLSYNYAYGSHYNYGLKLNCHSYQKHDRYGGHHDNKRNGRHYRHGYYSCRHKRPYPYCNFGGHSLFSINCRINHSKKISLNTKKYYKSF